MEAAMVLGLFLGLAQVEYIELLNPLNLQKVPLQYSHYRYSVIVLGCFVQCATKSGSPYSRCC
jgi:hypothetical protein